jgi:hypothetical protein
MTKHTKHVEWTQYHETILVEWADKAMCYRWLHVRSNARFSRLNTLYTIPVIIISTLTGTANFAQDRVPIDYQHWYVMAVGCFNILAGIITTIQQFLKITQLNEAHRVSGIAWDKFYRNVKIELTKHPNERMDVTQMIKMCKEEFDRLIETSPVIPENIIAQFKSSFKQTDCYATISKPEVCDELVSTENFRNTFLNAENLSKRLSLEAAEHVKVQTDIEDKVISFRDNFVKMHLRQPLESEIIENLDATIDIDTLRKLIVVSNV